MAGISRGKCEICNRNIYINTYNFHKHFIFIRNMEVAGRRQVTINTPIGEPLQRDETDLIDTFVSSAKSTLDTKGTVDTKAAELKTPGSKATEFESRFKSRPLSQPHVVGLDGSELMKKRPPGQVRSVTGFYPPVKKVLSGGPSKRSAGSSTSSTTSSSSSKRGNYFPSFKMVSLALLHLSALGDF